MTVATRARTGGTIRVTCVDGPRRGDRPCTVIVDDVEAGDLRPGQIREFAVGPGDHVVRVRFGWQHSQVWQTSVTARDAVGFQCRWAGRKDPGRAHLCPSDPYDHRARAVGSATPPAGDDTRGRRGLRVLSKGGWAVGVVARRAVSLARGRRGSARTERAGLSGRRRSRLRTASRWPRRGRPA